MSSPLEGKAALVTGASSGIGAALTAALVGRGVRVAGLGRDADRLAEAKACLGDRFVPLRADLALPEERARALTELHAAFPRLDVLINNAAEVVYETPLGLGAEGLSRLFEINAVAGLDLVRGALPLMGAGAHVLNVSSVTARFLPNAKFASYALSKAALDGLTAVLRLELEPRAIHVSLLSLGLVDTPVYQRVAGFAAMRQKLVEQVPAWLSPEQVAEAALWMLERPPPVVATELVLLPGGQVR